MIDATISVDMTDLATLTPTGNSRPHRRPDGPATQRLWQLIVDPAARAYVYSTADDARAAAAAMTRLADWLDQLDTEHQPDPMEDQ